VFLSSVAMSQWKVLGSSVVINTLVKGTLKSLGVLMLELGSRGIDTAAASWVPAIAYTLFAILSSPVAKLAGLISHRGMAALGGIVIVLGVLLSAFPHLPNLYLGLGVALGTGGCMCSITGVLEINKQFTGSSRGLAHGFSLAGNTVGGLVLPGLIALLMEGWGYKGALLILAGILLHIIPVSLFYSSRKDSQVVNTAESKSENKKVFKNPRLWFCIFSMASTTVGYTNFGLYLPLHLHTYLGFTKTVSASYISIFALGDLSGRLTGPALSDKFSPRWMWYCGGLIGAGSAMLCISICVDGFIIGGLTLLAGLFSGVMVGVYPALLSDELGAENLSITYPLSQTMAGLLNLAGPPLLGMLATVLETSYVMLVLGVSLIVGSLPLAVASIVMHFRASSIG